MRSWETILAVIKLNSEISKYNTKIWFLQKQNIYLLSLKDRPFIHHIRMHWIKLLFWLELYWWSTSLNLHLSWKKRRNLEILKWSDGWNHGLNLNLNLNLLQESYQHLIFTILQLKIIILNMKIPFNFFRNETIKNNKWSDALGWFSWIRIRRFGSKILIWIQPNLGGIGRTSNGKKIAVKNKIVSGPLFFSFKRTIFIMDLNATENFSWVGVRKGGGEIFTFSIILR